MFRRAIKNTYILSLGTFLSRVLGFLRDILIANFFGTSGLLEAFLVSFRLPNIFRSIFAEGFSDSVATPVLSEHNQDKKRLFAIGANMISFLVVILLSASLLGSLFSKYLVALIAPGFIGQEDKFNLAVSFTHMTFIYLFLIGLASAIMSILYSLRKFLIPAINPAFLNISFIAGILFFNRFFKNYILVICVLIAGILQVIIPFVFLKKEGFYFKFDFLASLRDKEVIKMLRLFVPRIWSSVVYHMSVFIDTIFASLHFIVGQGALASIYYADRLIQFPFALVALSVSRVAIVDLSSYHSQGKVEEFKKLLVFSFQNIIFFILPIVFIFIFLSEGLLDVFFTRGRFDQNSLRMTSSILFFYSFGLFFFCGIKLLVNSFYSLKDTRTPAKTATFSLIINIILSAVLMFPLKAGGIALGSSLAAMANFFILYHLLAKKIGHIDWQDTKSQFFKVFLLSISAGFAAHFLWDFLLFNKYIKMLIILSAISFLFVTLGYMLGLKQVRYAKQWILKKK